MSILDIVTEPNPLLHQTCREIRSDEFGEELSKKLSDMAETMYAMGGVGLAGPQVGDLRRILVADLSYAEITEENRISGKYGSKLIKMINPQILSYEGSQVIVEGCLSIPNFQHSVNRSNLIKVSYLNELGETFEEEFSGFLSVIIQHEIDHLNGKTLLSKSSTLKKSQYLKKIKNGKTSR